jgi:hypothetical protein
MSSNKIAVISAQTGDRDALREDHVTTGADFIAFVEKPFDSRVWEQRPVCRNFRSHRRNSRMHKILIHQYVNAGYSLWIDANVALRVPAEQLIDEWLRDHDIAMFKHRIRDCIYDEADVCAKLELDDPRLIREQRETYRQRGFPRNAGLGEASVILRRHTKEIRNFNNAWWAEYCRFSVRDQISGMVAAHETSTAINLVTPTKFDHPYFQISPRPPGVEPKSSY